MRAALDPATIPSPRPAGWVVDQAHVLSIAQIAEINRLGDAVHACDGAEMAIIVVPTIGGGDHRAWAVRLFNRWEIGDRVRNNGVLIFVAVGDRAAEIVLGAGLDSSEGRARSDRVMRDEMLPRFRESENAAAIVAAAQACAREFFDVHFTPAAPTAAPDPAMMLVEAPDPERASGPPPTRPAKPTTRSAPASTTLHGSRSGLPVAVFAGVGVLLLGGVGAGIAVAASRPRRCGRCGVTMQKLDEVADDQHLSQGERLEERLGSVDYTIWMCPGCSAVEKRRSGRWFTRFSACPQCGQVTSSDLKTTLQHATEWSGGLVEIREHCEHCGRTHVYRRSTPRITRSSNSSGSGGRSSSGFGGGRSSGGGSSGKW
ncbi:MAG: TPM domain-containing protein [Opitutaceae bacterium]|nr:TPM domain-containing protein [Opitutaceae bacterium]